MGVQRAQVFRANAAHRSQTLLVEACEERAGATDPYRRVAALTHVIADRD